MKTIVITGASKGLGFELAMEVAKPDVRLFLCARGKEGLQNVATKCQQNGADVEIATVDMSDSIAVDEWIASIYQQGSVDMVYLNAGVFGGSTNQNKLEALAVSSKILAVNLSGCIHASNRFAEQMQKQGKGHLIFISSLAAYAPLADAPSYSASKAGLSAYAKGLREFLLADNIQVSIIHPGHINTAQSEVQSGKMPMMMDAAQVAKKVVKAVDRGAITMAFPRTLFAVIWCGSWLPWRMQAWLNKSLRFQVKKEGTIVDREAK